MIKRTNSTSWSFAVLSMTFSWLLLFSCGCGGVNSDGRMAVSGTVTWNGESLETGYVLFASTSGGKSSGGQIVDGSFELVGKQGIPKGKYKVKITASRPSGKKIPDSDFPDQMIDAIEQFIPKRYNSKTELTLEVDGPPEPLAYDLKKNK